METNQRPTRRLMVMTSSPHAISWLASYGAASRRPRPGRPCERNREDRRRNPGHPGAHGLGSDWPHSNETDTRRGRAVLADWAPGEATCRRVLVENPGSPVRL
jgi:hypothetical protein